MRRIVPGTPWRALIAAVLLLPAGVLAAGRALAGPDDVPSIAPMTTTELDDLVAPVALYPDVVLDAMFPASTAPGDVAAAAVFLRAEGGAATAPPADAAWDPSVVALLQFPEVVTWMGENPAWVERTGFAVTMQQGDLLSAVQRYRARARAAGALVTDEHAVVTVQPGAVIVIEAARPDIVYVPVYDPWRLDGWSVGSPFYASWFGFSFGGRGLWGYHRIFWGAGIYAYQDAWWGSSWRNRASDWGTSRPSRYRVTRRSDQPWTRTGWNHTERLGRVVAPRTTVRSTTPRAITVTPPTRRDARRTSPTGRGGFGTTPTTPRVRRDTTVPGAPVTPWRRTPTPTTAPTPRRAPATPGTLDPRATAPRSPTPTVVPRRTVDAWRNRGGGSLEPRTRTVPPARPFRPAVPATPAMPRVRPAVPAVPTVAPTPRVPQMRPLPPARPTTGPLDGSRARDTHHRGRKSLLGE